MYAVESGTTTAVQDSAIGLFTDLTLGFETCDVSSLDITKVTLGSTEIASSNFSWIDGDLIVDFTAMTSDPDGPEGLLDADGDGFFDDLPGGHTLNLQVELSFICELPDDPTTLACNSIDCSFSQFFISAQRDCGQTFQFFPDIEDFNILNGATFIELKDQDQINTSTIGYNFGTVGNTNACAARPVSVKTVQFCYIYERENVTPCPDANTTNELQVVFSGSPMAVYDIEFVPGSGTVSVNGTNTITGANGAFTNLAPDTRMLSLPIGDLAIGDEVCYTYQLEADTASCAPPQWMTGTHQVIETCTTSDCVCKTVKACDAALFRIDPADCNCICDISSGSSFKRISLGYTDPTMTTKVKEEDVPIEDLNRYLPCDTMLFEGWLVPNTNEAVNNPYWWYARSYVSGNTTWTGADDTELMYDVAGSHFLGFEVANGDGTRTFVDINSFPSCLDNGAGLSLIHI